MTYVTYIHTHVDQEKLPVSHTNFFRAVIKPATRIAESYRLATAPVMHDINIIYLYINKYIFFYNISETK